MKVNNATPQIKNNVTFGKTPEKLAKLKQTLKSRGQELLTLQRSGPMSRDLFIANAFAFLLGTRLITSRDKDEKREILIRDIPTIVIAVMGVPAVQNLVAGKIQNKSGFAFMKEGKKAEGFAKWISEDVKKLGEFLHIGKGKNKEEKIVKKVVNYAELKDLYVFDENLASGFDGFAKRLSGQEGNLKKIFSSLGKEVKESLKSFSDKNNEFLQQLSQDKKLKDTIANGFKDVKNNALKQASWVRTIPTLIGFAATLSIVGLLIPKTNIAITESINKKRKAQELARKQTQESQDAPKTEQASAPAETNLIKQYKKA